MRTLFKVALVIAVTLTVGGCGALGQQAQQPARAWVDGSRQVYEVVAPRFEAYVLHDDTLDASKKDALLRVVSDWDFMIREGETHVTPGTPRPLPVQPTGGHR